MPLTAAYCVPVFSVYVLLNHNESVTKELFYNVVIEIVDDSREQLFLLAFIEYVIQNLRIYKFHIL